MVNKKKYKFRGLVSMFKKGNCLSISIDSNINLSATQLHPIHHPAGSLSHLWRFKLNHTAPLGLPILHLDVRIQHVACAQGGKKRPQLIRQTRSQPQSGLDSVQITCERRWCEPKGRVEYAPPLVHECPEHSGWDRTTLALSSTPILLPTGKI